MCRTAIAGFALHLTLAFTVCAQEMRTGPKEYGLTGNVQSVETTLVDMSTKSYKLRPGGRESLYDFGNPSAGSPDAPLLWEVLRFDAKGKLAEDVDLERPLIEQESYRYVYTYNPRGLLVEKAGYREDSSSDGKNVYSYSPEGRKIEELIYSGDGRVQGRYEFDEHENFTSVEWYREDGSVRQKDNHRYEYVTKGNTLEQIYYPPQRQPGSAGFTFYAPLGGVPEKSAKIMTPLRYRTVFVRDDAGHVREESRYDVDGSLHEKKIFDQSGVLRRKEWGLGESSLTTTVYDETGREVELHTFAKQGFLSPRAVNDRTLFSYDGHGNLTEMITSGPDNSLVRRTTNVFEYDNHGTG